MVLKINFSAGTFPSSLKSVVFPRSLELTTALLGGVGRDVHMWLKDEDADLEKGSDVPEISSLGPFRARTGPQVCRLSHGTQLSLPISL